MKNFWSSIAATNTSRVCLALLAGLVTARAQTNFYTITSTGSVSNRVNIVFLAEGYRTNDYAQFLTDVTNAANILLTNQPYAEYRSNFNVFAIAVPSTNSGSDHPCCGVTNSTFFSSTFDYGSDYYLSFPTNQLGQGRVDSLLNTFIPQSDLAILLVNDNLQGGSDGGGRTAIVSRGALFVVSSYNVILTHETGHVLGGLGDEYTDAYPGFPDIEEPNTTRETNRASIKWNAWISTNTPVPTPGTAPYSGVVGLFEGAHYHTTGWYRPKLNCMMKSLGVGFCEVCTEALVLAYYRQARPVDAFAPSPTNQTFTTTQAVNFSLTLLQPVTHSLSVQWYTNGVPLPSQTNAAFTLLPASLGNGSHTVSARVVDPTSLVRTDPTNLLSQTNTWSITVSVPQLTLSSPRWLGTNGFTFHVSGVAPAGFSVHASSNFVSWTSLATNSLVAGQFDFTNKSATNFSLRFYRASTPPAP